MFELQPKAVERLVYTFPNGTIKLTLTVSHRSFPMDRRPSAEMFQALQLWLLTVLPETKIWYPRFGPKGERIKKTRVMVKNGPFTVRLEFRAYSRASEQQLEKVFREGLSTAIDKAI